MMNLSEFSLSVLYTTYTSCLEIYAFIFFNTNLFFFSEVNYIIYYLENSFMGLVFL